MTRGTCTKLGPRQCIKGGLSSHLPKKLFLFASMKESPLKVIKNAFYFMLKALFVLEIFPFLSWLFGYVEKGLNKGAKDNFKLDDVIDWTTNNCNTYIAQYRKN